MPPDADAELDAGSQAPALRLHALSLSRGRRTLIEAASLSVAPGAFVGVFGANGSGKTTLLRAILGLVRPAAGRIEISGRPARRGAAIGVMAQQLHFPPATLQLAAGVLLEASTRALAPGLGGRAARIEIDTALDLVEARHLRDRRLGTLSGGERQRLLLGQALIGRPPLLLLDEPLAALDPRFQAEAVTLVDRIRRQLGTTVLFTAHDLNPMLGVIDQALLIGGGAARLMPPRAMLDPDILGALYGTPMQVIRAEGRTLVVPR